MILPAIRSAIFSATPNRPCKLPAIYTAICSLEIAAVSSLLGDFLGGNLIEIGHIKNRREIEVVYTGPKNRYSNRG